MILIEARHERAHRVVHRDAQAPKVGLNEPKVSDLRGRHAGHRYPAGQCGGSASILSEPVEGRQFATSEDPQQVDDARTCHIHGRERSAEKQDSAVSRA